MNFIGGDSGERAAGDVADDVAAGAFGREADGIERVDHFRERLDGEPVELDVLADGDVGEVAGVLARDAADDAELMCGEDAVGDADAHHEVVGGEAFAALAAGGADAVALGVDAPPFEVERGPLGHHAGAAVARELAHLVEGFPGILCELEALGALGLGFFHLNSLIHFFPSAEAESPRQLGLYRGLTETLNLRLDVKTQVTSAREAAYKSDNRRNDPYIDDGRGLRKLQGLAGTGRPGQCASRGDAFDGS